MSIATEISRLQQAKADIKTSIEAKGVTVPSSALIDTYSGYVDQISGGGGLAYHSGTITINNDQTTIAIPYTGTSQNVVVMLVHQSPTYNVNNTVGFFGASSYFNGVTITSGGLRLYGTLEVRTNYSNYAQPFFGYSWTAFVIGNSDITMGVRNNLYPYQAGTYDYMIIEL